MLNFLRSKIYPIGIDLGRSSIKLMQLTTSDNELVLTAAAREDVPDDMREEPGALQEWTVEAIRRMLAEKPFKGKKAVMCLPARDILIRHLRMPRMDEQQLQQALTFEVQDKLPFDVRRALLRHIVAGQIYEESEARQEVIIMAAARQVVEHYLKLIERTRMEVESVNIEPYALMSGFTHMLQQNSENDGAVMFVDLGESCVKVVICRGLNITFCRKITPGIEGLTARLSSRLSVDTGRARFLLAASGSGDQDNGSSAHAATATATASPHNGDVYAAITPCIQELCQELRSCVRYHDLCFNQAPVRKVVFVGGMTKNTPLCQKIAQGVHLPAQVGDPLARIAEKTRTGSHSDLDVQGRNSEWAVAFGLSLATVNPIIA